LSSVSSKHDNHKRYTVSSMLP